MPIDPVQLVTDQLETVFALDSTLQAIIPRQVEAQIAVQGWSSDVLTDQQNVYVGLLALKSIIPRLLLTFAQEVEKAEGGHAKVQFQKAYEYLKQLQGEVKEQLTAAAKETDPSDVELYMTLPPWPGVGMQKWEDPD